MVWRLFGFFPLFRLPKIIVSLETLWIILPYRPLDHSLHNKTRFGKHILLILYKQEDYMKYFTILTILGLLLAPSQAAFAVEPTHRVAIVIDDFGNGQRGTDEMFRLGVPITAAVMPFLPTTTADAELAHQLGHDVLVHLPMEPMSGKWSWLGPGAITTRLTDEEIRKRVEDAVEDVPHAIGINNHMGSKATADHRVMRIVMEVCRERKLFYLDSRTSYRSKAGEEATANGVPILNRHIFLDEVYSSSHVRKQIRKLLEHAKEEPTTIAIGHVGPPGKITSAVLKESIPDIQAVARIVRLSELLPQPMLP